MLSKDKSQSVIIYYTRWKNLLKELLFKFIGCFFYIGTKSTKYHRKYPLHIQHGKLNRPLRVKVFFYVWPLCEYELSQKILDIMLAKNIHLDIFWHFDCSKKVLNFVVYFCDMPFEQNLLNIMWRFTGNRCYHKTTIFTSCASNTFDVNDLKSTYSLWNVVHTLSFSWD